MVHRRIGFLSLTAALLAASSALAQVPPAPGPATAPRGPGFKPGVGRHHRGPGPMLERLGLDEAQREKVEAIHLRSEKERIRRVADLEIAEIELQELLAAPAPDRKKVHAQVERLAGLQAEVRKVEVDRHLDVLEELTPEQRQKMKALTPALGPRRGARFHMRLRDPDPERIQRRLRLGPDWESSLPGSGWPRPDEEEEEEEEEDDAD